MRSNTIYWKLIVLILLAIDANAQITFQEAFTDSAISFEFPVEIQFSNDNSNRMFVLEQPGRIKVLQNESTTTSNDIDLFLDLTEKVYYSVGQETGLLGLAFHPNYDENGFFYVLYTAPSPVSGISIRIVLARYTVDQNNPNLADIDSELILFQFDKNQNNSNHNGGKIAFGPDGYLYISFGDGGGGNDPEGNAQNINNVFGSICRIDVDLDGNNPIESNPDLPSGNYEIPSDNPFASVDGLDEIYAYGIRNTWKFSFDFQTGRLWGADVGQNDYEEINLIEIGKNYGWSRFEANSIANSDVIIDETTEFPIYFYDHSEGDQSITGGYVYRGSEITSLEPNINSKYIFGDYVSGRVWALDYNSTTGEATRELLFDLSGQFISSFGQDKNGEIYFSDYGQSAKIYKIVDGQSSATGDEVSGVGIWQEIDSDDINGPVMAIESTGDGTIYFGGNFNQVGSLEANNIVKWNPEFGWEAMGTGTNGIVNTLKLNSNGNLIVGGSFTEVNGVSVNNIAVYDGIDWSGIGNGSQGPILSVEISAIGHIIVGGIFESIGGIAARNIALWDGIQWNAMVDSDTSHNGTNNEIRALHFDDSEILYVGGNFDEAGGKTANRIATWNGSQWSTLGEGTSGFVQAIASNDSDIFIGGNFAVSGNQTVNRIARWHKETLSYNKIENGVDNNVNALVHDGNYLYAAGSFDVAFGLNQNSIVNNIARWSSDNGFEALGETIPVGVDTKINALCITQNLTETDSLVVGGNFTRAGSVNTSNSAIWSPSQLGDEDETEIEQIAVYSDINSNLIFVTGALSLDANFELFDLLGRLVLNKNLDNQLTSNTISVSTLQTGVYVARVNSDGDSYIKKLIIK